MAQDEGDNRPIWVTLRALAALDDELLDILSSYEEVATFHLSAVAPGVNVGGIFQSLLGGTVVRVNLSQGTEGSSGSTVIDGQINGTTMFTTIGNRPTLPFGTSPGIVQQTVIENAAVPANGNITMSVISAQGGSPANLRVDVFIRKAITARSYTNYALSGDAPTISIIYVP